MIYLQGPGHFLLTDCDPPFNGLILTRNSARCDSAALRHHSTEGSSGFGVEYIWRASASGCPQLKAYTVVGANIYAPGDSTDQPIDTDNDGQPDTRYELATPGSPARIDTDDDGIADTDITINKFARLVPRNDDDTDNNGEPDYLDDARRFGPTQVERVVFEAHEGVGAKLMKRLGLPSGQSWRRKNEPAALWHIYEHRMNDPEGLITKIHDPLRALEARWPQVGPNQREQFLADLYDVYEAAGHEEYGGALVDWLGGQLGIQ